MKKKIFLTLALLSGLSVSAQDNWDTLIRNGLNKYANFDFVKSFNGKLYVGGNKMYVDTNVFLRHSAENFEKKQTKPHQIKSMAERTSHAGATPLSLGGSDTLRIFSSSDGLSFSEDTGFYNVAYVGTSIKSLVSNDNHLFIGTGNNDYTWPQVYHLDGTTNTYSIHDTIHYDTVGYNSFTGVSNASIGALAIFSAGGANDSIYAFVNPGYSDSTMRVNGPSVYKSSISNPGWINAVKFDSASGIQYINDAIVWHKTLYVSTEAYDVNYNSTSTIISTTDGSHWDTVAKILPLLTPYGITSTGNYFNKFEIHRDTLIVAIYGSNLFMPIWYTTDSMNTNPAWYPYIGTNPSDSTILANNWGYINHVKSFGNKLWLEFTYGGEVTAAIYHYDTHNGLRLSTQNTYFQNSYSGSNNLYFDTFNNKIYSSGTVNYFSSSQPLSSGGYFYNGTLGALGMPVANFTDSASSGFCSGNYVTFYNTSTNSTFSKWYKNDTLLTTSDISGNFQTNFFLYFYSAGTYQIKQLAYSTSDTTSLVDSITKTITIYTPPTIDSMYTDIAYSSVHEYTVCQGQPVKLSAAVSPSTGNYTYQWVSYAYTIQLYDTLYGNNAVATFTYNTVGGPSYYVYITVKDNATGCTAPNPDLTATFYVNQSDSISGLIKAPDGSLATKGQVYLFKQKLNHVGVADSTASYSLVSVPAGYFTFANAYYGDYYIQASLDTNMYPTSINTYYTNPVKLSAFQWDSATVIQHYGCSGANDTLSIQVEQIIPSSGSGFISGTVVRDSTFGMRFGNGYNSVMGAPLKGVGVSLGKTPGGGSAARTVTNDTGYYSFPNVGIGTYRIYVDIPNYGMDSVRLVTISSSDSISINNDYRVDSTKIYVVAENTSGIFTQSQVNSTGVKVYPNPTGNIAYVDFYNNREAQVVANLYDLSGNLIRVLANEKMPKGAQSIRICLVDMQLSAGVYIIKANINNSIQNFKLTVIQN